MNLKEIREMINLMNDNELSEIEIEREGTKIKIKKSSSGFPEIVHRSVPNFRSETQLAAEPTPTASSVPAANPNVKEIKSPMVGTFYRAPSPESPSFIEAGQMVEVGQVVCIVEAMKLMNEIKSEVKGKVVEVMVDNAQPVEFGQVLFTVEPVK